MTRAILEIVETGSGVSFQDQGRRGWKRFGVPPGGAIDDHAAPWANALLGNPSHVPVLEILLVGARFRVLTSLEIAVTGASASGEGQRWQTHRFETNQVFTLPAPAHGLWSYLACPGGFDAPRWFGSVSTFPRGGLGHPLSRGDIVHATAPALLSVSPAIGARWVDPRETRDYRNPPSLRLWRGPQWDQFEPAARMVFFDAAWEVSSRSDRTGYRLTGPALNPPREGMLSEPVLPGSVQVPPDGLPIVTMNDGPTVGGYPKLGVLDPEDLSRLAQCRPGQSVRFVPVEP